MPNAAPRSGRLFGDVAVPMKPVMSAAAGAAVTVSTQSGQRCPNEGHTG